MPARMISIIKLIAVIAVLFISIIGIVYVLDLLPAEMLGEWMVKLVKITGIVMLASVLIMLLVSVGSQPSVEDPKDEN